MSGCHTAQPCAQEHQEEPLTAHFGRLEATHPHACFSRQLKWCSMRCRANPVANGNGGAGGAWPLNTGNDFLPNHLANGIDYGSIHMWPDNWGRTDLPFGK